MSIKFQDVQAVFPRGSFTACALTLLLSACGGGGGGGNNSQATSTAPPPPPPPPVTSVTIAPATLDFGKVVIGDTVAGTAVVSNTGETTVSIELPALGDGFAEAANDCVDLAPDEELQRDNRVHANRAAGRIRSAISLSRWMTEDLDLALNGEGQGSER